MNEDYTNRFVVQRESGHPGYIAYTVISTREGMNDLANGLQAALAKEPEQLRRDWETPDDPLTLMSEYATIARGQRSRVTLAEQENQDGS